MNKSNSLIWVLADDRPGNSSQAIGLAENLQRPFLIKKITYNKYSKLPNFLKINGLIGISEDCKDHILDQINKPQIIISAGRKTAPLALYLKKIYHSRFLIHIMNPNGNLKKFDAVILPKHDQLEASNIITSIGSLNRINDQILTDDYQKFAEKLQNIKSPKIALIIGGSSKNKVFDLKTADNLIKICINIAQNMNARFLITTSKRTDENLTYKFKNDLEKYCDYFYFWQENSINPYFALLKAADFIIVTGDSMSMCSESCTSGKPVYIFNPENICSKKHLRLHQNLFDENYAKQLKSDVTELISTVPEKLNETVRISKYLDELLTAKNL